MKKYIIIYFICGFVFWNELVAQNHNKKSLPRSKTINITLQISNPERQRAFSLKLDKHVFERRLPDLTQTCRTDEKGNCTFSINDPGSLVYITIEEEFTDRSTALIQQYLAEPGDAIHIQIISKFEIMNSSQFLYYSPLQYNLVISGRGAAKYQWRYEFDKMLTRTSGDRRAIDSNGNFIAKEYKYPYYDHAEKVGQQLLYKYKSKLDPKVYNILLVDLISALETERLREIPFNFKDSLVLNKIKTAYSVHAKRLEKYFTDEARNFSPVYGLYALEKVIFGKRFYSNSPNLEAELRQAIAQIKNNYSGEVRDKALTFLGLRLPRTYAAEGVLNEILQTIETDYCQEELSSFADKNFVGRAAFPFSLPDSSGRIYKLKDFEGKVVFMDFWFKGCGNCVIYYDRIVSKVEELYRNNPDVVFLTINTDRVRGDWIEGLKKGIYTSPDAINLSSGGPNHPIVQNYRAWAAPKPLLIGRDGKIFSNDNVELRGGADKLEETIKRALVQKY